MAVNVQAAVEAQVLGMNLMGMVDREEDKEKNQIKTEFLILPSTVDESVEFGIEDVVKEINETIYRIRNNTDNADSMKKEDEVVSQEDVTKALSVIGLEDVTFTFMQTFIHYTKVTEDDGTGNTTFEYAIGIHIKGERATEKNEFKFLQFKEAYINVWDTNKQTVLERMQIWTPEQLGIKLEG